MVIWLLLAVLCILFPELMAAVLVWTVVSAFRGTATIF